MCISLFLSSCPSPTPFQAVPGTSIWVKAQIVYFRGNRKKPRQRVGDWDWESGKQNKRYINQWVTATGNWGSILSSWWGTQRQVVEYTLGLYHWGDMNLDYFVPSSGPDWVRIGPGVFPAYGTVWLEPPPFPGRERHRKPSACIETLQLPLRTRAGS